MPSKSMSALRIRKRLKASYTLQRYFSLIRVSMNSRPLWLSMRKDSLKLIDSRLL